MLSPARIIYDTVELSTNPKRMVQYPSGRVVELNRITFHTGLARFDTRPKSCEDAAHAALDYMNGK
jgi:hypothetical protein